MKARGYPVSDFDQRAADISVDHPRVVENYRSAHEIALRVGKDAATTEDLRTAMIHYRSLFEELVQVPTSCGKERGGVMAELKDKEEELTTAELASYGIAQKQPDGPKLVKGQEPETPDRATAVAKPMPLFSESEMGDFRSQWSKVQTGFVDEPRQTVEDADKLVAAVMQRLAEGFANERSGLEKQWDSGDNVSTEDLRLALQRYRSFFDRLLKL